MNANTIQYNNSGFKTKVIDYIVWLRGKVCDDCIFLYDKYFNNKIVLELGCWAGDFGRILKKKLNKYRINFELIGLDINNLLDNNNLSVYKKYIVLDKNDIFINLKKIIKEEKIDTVIIPYVFHHIWDDNEIVNYIKIFSNLGLDIVIFEEYLPNNFLKSVVKFLYIINDITSNLLRYGINIDFKEYFGLNFKSANEWFNILKKYNYEINKYYTYLRPNFINNIVIFAKNKIKL